MSISHLYDTPTLLEGIESSRETLAIAIGGMTQYRWKPALPIIAEPKPAPTSSRPHSQQSLTSSPHRVLRVIVAMPILIVTSYYLYKRGMFQFLTRDYLFSWKWGWRNWNLDPPPKQLDHLIEEIYEKFGEVEHHEYEYLKNRAADANRSFWTTYSGFRRGKKTVP